MINARAKATSVDVSAADLSNPAAMQQLEDVLARLEQTDSTQIAVLTITSLGGEVLEEFSIKVVDH